MNASTGHMTGPSPQKSTCHEQHLQSQQALTEEKPHLRIPLAVGLSTDVCAWLWLSAALQEKNQMFSVRPSWCNDSSFPRIPHPFTARGGLSHVGWEWQGKPSNEAAWTRACLWWSLLWNLAASPSFCFLFFFFPFLNSPSSAWTVDVKRPNKIRKRVLFMDGPHKHATQAPCWCNLLCLEHVALLVIYLPCSNSRNSPTVNLSFSYLLTLATVHVWMCTSLSQCVCVFDMTRSDLPSFLFLSRHVIPRFSVVMVTAVIDSFSVPARLMCVEISGILVLISLNLVNFNLFYISCSVQQHYYFW